MSNHINTYLKTAKSVHFIGIGGVSMSALALIMQSQGYHVTGSDANPENCAVLRSGGIAVKPGHDKAHALGADLVVYTAAIRPDNPELMGAHDAGIPCFERADLLGALISHYKCPIGVAGTHGKSTTSSMLSCILLDAGVDPTLSIGAMLPQIGSTYHIGKNDYFVFESCEYAGSFLKFFPKVSVILNIDADHLDYYKDLDEIIRTFEKYAQNTLPGGVLILNGEDENCRRVARAAPGKVLTFGLNDADYTAQNLIYTGGLPEFDLCRGDETLCRISLIVPGEHNVKNALAAAAAADYAGIDPGHIARGLKSFKGTHRRFEFKGKKDGYTVIDDYAHHPAEIEATLKAVKNMDFDRVIVIFQPHTYSRTKAFFPDFVQALSAADAVVVCDIYAAREQNDPDIHAGMLADCLENAAYAADFAQAADLAQAQAGQNTVILTMGAGDVYKTVQYLLG